jgi:hypothetical protein
MDESDAAGGTSDQDTDSKWVEVNSDVLIACQALAGLFARGCAVCMMYVCADVYLFFCAY